MTYRERREAKVERLRGWAEKRKNEAAATIEREFEAHRGDVAFNTQPGHIPERARSIARVERAVESLDKGRRIASRAAGIADQLAHSIYSDDPDADERLTDKIERLEAMQTAYKTANAAYRKEHKAELAAMGPYARDEAMPAPSYRLSNLSARIRDAKRRLAAIADAKDGTKPMRVIQAHRDGTCERCGHDIATGAWIGKYADGWSHVIADGDRWTRCEV